MRSSTISRTWRVIAANPACGPARWSTSANPTIRQKPARVFRVGVNMRVIHHEKAGIEAPRTIGWRHGAGDEIHMCQRRHDTMSKIGVPFMLRLVGGASEASPRISPVSSNVSRMAAKARPRKLLSVTRDWVSLRRRVNTSGANPYRKSAGVGRVAPTAGENKLIGHEFVGGGALAQQNFRGFELANDNQRCASRGARPVPPARHTRPAVPACGVLVWLALALPPLRFLNNCRVRFRKAVHSQCPLQADHRAFDHGSDISVIITDNTENIAACTISGG